MKRILFTVALASALYCSATENQRWNLNTGQQFITLPASATALPHSDHVEMSGKKMAVVLYWNLDSASHFGLNRALVFPMLRTIPNDTHASLMINNDVDVAGMVRIGGKPVKFATKEVTIDGMMTVTGEYIRKDTRGTRALELTRRIYPSMEHPAMFETYTLVNTGDTPLDILIPSFMQNYITDSAKGVAGSYIVKTEISGAGAYSLLPGQQIDFAVTIQAYPKDVGASQSHDPLKELDDRRKFISTIDSSLILDTPDEVIDAEFRYAKIRGSESIYKTKGGYMHGPGGESYYAALWCNDQAEYINPFFPFLGYDVGNESAMNCFRHYARFINDEYKPIPSSIIAEGDDIWNGAGDRGDAAMLAYGAARYALARGDRSQAKELWPLIEWCLEYCHRRLNSDGVVESDHDELEGRFPAGTANLCTASLYYDALISTVYLGKGLGKPKSLLSTYSTQASDLRRAIDRYFGANVKGYDTYRYYDGNDVLRSWICIPLVMGIDERADQTVKALFSPEMYTSDGVLTCQGYPIFWDRATLYTLRGALHAGYPDEVIPLLSDYSRRRLLGDHVPYPVEAWPEGSQRHLSAESGLYCRIITEGLFGIRPTGFNSFELKPELPSDWNYATLSHIKAFGTDFDINLKRLSADSLQVTVTDHAKGRKITRNVKNGRTISIKL